MLDSRVLSSIADLEFVARLVVEGSVSGLHRSPFHGYSAEFSQYRHYRQGDDLKYVDWKLFARTDRVYTKQYRETTNVPVQLAVDASASMAFRGSAGVSKFEFARVLAAALAHVIASNGDAVGLAVFDDTMRSHVPSRSGQPHFRSLLTTLSTTVPAGATAAARALRTVVELLKRRSVLMVLSDLYGDEEGVDAELRRATRAGHDVALFHVLSRDEVDFPYSGDVEFEDVETGEKVLTNAAGIAGAYRAGISAFLDRWRARCVSSGIDYTLAVTDRPPEEVLRTFLVKRSRAATR